MLQSEAQQHIYLLDLSFNAGNVMICVTAKIMWPFRVLFLLLYLLAFITNIQNIYYVTRKK